MNNKILNKNFSIGQLYYLNEMETESIINEIFHYHTYLGKYLTLRPGSVVFDIGANVGIFSLYAMKQCNDDALIYSFEPIPITFECLKRNLKSYKNKVFLYNAGISNVENECMRDFTLFSTWSILATYRPKDKIISNFLPLLNYETLLAIAKDWDKPLYYQLKFLPFMRPYLIKRFYKQQTIETKVPCRVISLGDFIKKHHISRIDFLKIDVEGAEFDVIKSIEPEQFRRIQQISIEAHDICNRVSQISTYLQKQGFVVHVVTNPLIIKLGFNRHMLYCTRQS